MPKIQDSKYLIFDVEVFPNWWCICFSTIDGWSWAVTSDNYNVLNLKKLFNNYILTGFNIKNYDMKIIDAIMRNYEPERIYQLSHNIISETEDYLNNVFWWNKYAFCDLFDDWKNGSLKEYESNNGMNIKESSLSFDRPLFDEADKEETLQYCFHDVKATVALFKDRSEYINAKLALADLFEIEPLRALKSTNAKLASIILKAIPKKREDVVDYILPDKVKDYVTHYLPSEVLDMFKTLNYDEKKAKLFNNDVVFGIGGIHSVYSNNIKTFTDDDYMLINVDVTSYYPNLIMHFAYMSRNVIDPTIYNKIYDLRVEYKRKAQKEKEEHGKTDLYWSLQWTQAGLKLILNTVYGATKNKYNPLYDPYIAGSLCYTGQICLAALAAQINEEIDDCKVIQTNTDGILVKIPRKAQKHLEEIVHHWETMMGFSMEFDYISAFYQRDVNNYIECTGNPKDPYKLKGKWSNQALADEIETNLNAPICHKAILLYYTENVPIEKTINECNDILSFCFTTKTGRSYDSTYYEYDEDYIETNRVNRVVATTDEKAGSIYKYKNTSPEPPPKPDPYLVWSMTDKEWERELKKYNTKLRQWNKKKLIFENKYGKSFGRMDKCAEIPDKCALINDEPKMIDTLDKEWYINFCKNKLEDLTCV